MGFFSRLGHKIKTGASRLGHKIHEVSGSVHRVAHKVADVSGKVATAALPFTAEIPVVGEVVGGVAAGSKAVQGVATGVNKVAKAVDRGSIIANKITR
jgi:hypothetical protein